MVTVEAIVHGAVSIVSAIATGNGATLGIDTFVKTRLKVKDGRGIHITSDNRTISSRLINKVIENLTLILFFLIVFLGHYFELLY